MSGKEAATTTAAPTEDQLKAMMEEKIAGLESDALANMAALPAGSFEAAETFAGPRLGFVFKNGDQGVGYYSDEYGKLTAALRKTEARLNPEAFQERRVEELQAFAAPAALPEPEIAGERIELEFTQPKWGIACRMSGGPVTVTKVKEGGEGLALGLQVGDVMMEIGGVSFTQNRSVALGMIRKGGPQVVKVVRPSEAVAVPEAAGTGEIGKATKALAGDEVVPTSVRELQAMIGGAKAKDTVTVNGQTGVTETLAVDSFGHSSTLVFFNCTDCVYTVEAYSLKVYLQGCKNVTVNFNGKILTSTLETFKCENLKIALNTKCGTVQADACDGLDITYAKKADFTMIVWAGCERLSVEFGDDASQKLASGFTEEAAKNATLNKDRSQFKISGIGGRIVQEPVVRLANGFTTTAREKKVFDDNQELALAAMAKEMGITIKPKKGGIKVKPNEPCPCGSGKKVKKCCPADLNGYWFPQEVKAK